MIKGERERERERERANNVSFSKTNDLVISELDKFLLQKEA